MFSIGQFSKITGLTVKTLRFYHEKGLLVPPCIDDETGYRYYNEAAVEKTRGIIALRDLGFSVADIVEIMESCADESDLIEHLRQRKALLGKQIRDQRQMLARLDTIIVKEREARTMADKATYEVEEKQIPAMLIAGVRMKGKYSDCGQGFSKLGRSVGRSIQGKPMNLYYDGEYKEDDADMEPFFPVKQSAKESPGISVRQLPGGRFATLLHHGPYEELGRSYEKLFSYLQRKELKTVLPSREVYLKGPGMIFRGNPKKYLTEIQMPIE